MKRYGIGISGLLLLCFLIFTGATDNGCSDGQSVATRESNKRLANVDTIMERQPAPALDFSMDRYILSERLKRLNDPTKFTYLYVVMQDGTWLKVTIIGKLASTSKRLNKPVQEYYMPHVNNVPGPAPDDMGVYGDSVGGHVGLTTLGSLIEFGGFISYIYSEVPLVFAGKKMIEVEVVATLEQQKKFLGSLKRR